MRTLLAGRLGKASYCLLLANLTPVYHALEAALDAHGSHPAIRPILFPLLHRGKALANDLQALHGQNWRQAIAAVPASADYTRHLEAIGDSQPNLLVAHAYVRYLGDINGGQSIRRIIARALHLSDQPGVAGLSFLDFGDAAQISQLAQNYRSGLDLTAKTLPEQDAIVTEAKKAFDMHVRLFGQLAACCEELREHDLITHHP